MLVSFPASMGTCVRKAERDHREQSMATLYADRQKQANCTPYVHETGIAKTMQQERTRKKAKNRFSREQAGTMQFCLRSLDLGNHCVKVCRTKRLS